MRKPEIIYQSAPGQRPIISEPACDCPQDKIRKFSDDVLSSVFKHMDPEDGLCAMGIATALLLVAAGMVNPHNVAEAYRKNAKAASRQYAHILEEAAKVIRERGSD